jgi:hypothetical protein
MRAIREKRRYVDDTELQREFDIQIRLYEGMSLATSSQSPPKLRGIELTEPPTAKGADNPMARRETLEVVRAYNKIPNATARRQLLSLIKMLSRDPIQEEE